jgi:hypothetical protein
MSLKTYATKKMKRITPQIKKIADLHIQAKKEKKFDNPKVTTKAEIIQKLNIRLNRNSIL